MSLALPGPQPIVKPKVPHPPLPGNGVLDLLPDEDCPGSHWTLLTQSCQSGCSCLPGCPKDGAGEGVEDRAAGLRPASRSPPRRADSPYLPPREPQPTGSAGWGAGLGSRSQQHLKLKRFPLFFASQTLPRSLREKSHQKNINLLIWGPTASLSRIPKPPACALSPPPRTLTAASGLPFQFCEPWAEL